MRGLALVLQGDLEAIPQGESLSRKTANVIEILGCLDATGVIAEITPANCKEARQIGEQIVEGLRGRASPEEKELILGTNFVTLIKLLAVSYYEEIYSHGYSLKSAPECAMDSNSCFANFV
jgi:hypothetical protein